MMLKRNILWFMVLVPLLILAAIYAHSGAYGVHALFRRGATVWQSISVTDSSLPSWMRLAFQETPPSVQPGEMVWKQVRKGFEVAELPVMISQTEEVDRILLTRIDPQQFRFEVHNRSDGSRELGDWMKTLKAAFVINGSYYDNYGRPDTPFLSNGVLLGPGEYDAKQGAFVSSSIVTGIRDLQKEDWQMAFKGADNALVSYPLLIAADGSSRVNASRLWLANRSFIGQDRKGRIIFGTTQHAFFSLERLALFLKQSPLDLALALNLDGGPVACQGISLDGFSRDFCGQWETSVHDGQLKLLKPALGDRRWNLPVVVAAFPK